MTEPTDWLQIAVDAYDSSTTYVDNNYRKSWEDSLRAFQNKHPEGSKYYSDTYKHRSKLFRPKTRSVIRKNEALAATAYFANMDVISTSPQDEADEVQRASADVMKELLQYRLTKTIPWFQTVMGAIQDAQVTGVVCSYQYWKYREKVKTLQQELIDLSGQVMLDEMGSPITQQVEEVEIIEDKPCIELWPVENLRIDPAASWIDPINTSPYVIRMIPMYVKDVRMMMKSMDSKTGQPKFKQVEEKDLLAAANLETDTTRNTRNDYREDPYEMNKPVSAFQVVWVHENIVNIDGEDMVYYTLSTQAMLTDPKPLKEVYFHGLRPVVMGCCVIETHKAYPTGIAALGADLQKQANDIVNQRLDNVKLVLNKRWVVRRGKQVDTQSLMKNAAGSVTMANELDDLMPIEFQDVTGSAYAEQDRVNLDYDELTGNFSAGSVQSNRQLNETVGGMGILSSGASQMGEYLIRTFNETWVEPVLRQLVKLEQAYETDQVILGLAGKKAQIFQKYGIDRVTDDLLNQELTLTVNVGTGATDPNVKLQKFLLAVNSFVQIAQAAPPNANIEEIAKEIFGQVGYKDGSRFFNKEVDPRIEMLTQQVQQLTQALQSKQMEQAAKMQDSEANRQLQLVSKQADIQNQQFMQERDLEFDYTKLGVDAGRQNVR